MPPEHRKMRQPPYAALVRRMRRDALFLRTAQDVDATIADLLHYNQRLSEGHNDGTESFRSAVSRLCALRDALATRESAAATEWLAYIRARLTEDNDAYADVDLLYGLYVALTGEEIPHPYEEQ